MSEKIQRPERGSNIPNAKLEVEVTAADLPLHCPMPDSTLWDSHPQVFIPIEDKGEYTCPYCGTHYVLKKEG